MPIRHSHENPPVSGRHFQMIAWLGLQDSAEFCQIAVILSCQNLSGTTYAQSSRLQVPYVHSTCQSYLGIKIPYLGVVPCRRMRRFCPMTAVGFRRAARTTLQIGKLDGQPLKLDPFGELPERRPGRCHDWPCSHRLTCITTHSNHALPLDNNLFMMLIS